MTEMLKTPKASDKLFDGGILHPELYLWDAWGHIRSDQWHLYCLAVNRYKNDGTKLLAHERNHFQFHIRHFSSSDFGKIWRDEGTFQEANKAFDGHEAGNIWSGSTYPLNDGRVLSFYTGILHSTQEYPYRQTIGCCIASSDSSTKGATRNVLSNAYKDYRKITAKGYFFSPRESLGHIDGESGGPITTWRDPYVYRQPNQSQEAEFKMVWAAKLDATTACIAAGLVEVSGTDIVVKELLSPMLVPDSKEFTQLEVPKIYWDQACQRFYLLCATTNRVSESQSEEEVNKVIRLYFSDSDTGPWIPAGNKSSILQGVKNQFGMTFLQTHGDSIVAIAPYTEVAGELGLSFAPVVEINKNTIGKSDYIVANPIY